MGNPKNVKVEVFIDDPTSTPPKFHFVTNDLPMGPENHLYFSNCGNSGFHVHFKLVNPPDNYRFPKPSQKDLALASQEGLGCPAQNAGHWKEFRPLRVEPDGMTLVVHNKNSEVKQFGYTLFVTNNDGASYLELDPGGTNTNGQDLMSALRTMTADTLVVAGAVATAAYLIMARSNFVDSPASLGTALLVTLTAGFALTALLFRVLPRG
jgi:hypothetical protein